MVSNQINHNEKKYSELAHHYYEQGKLEEAKILFEISFHMNPHDIRHGQNLAFIYARSGDLAEAVKIYKVLLGLFPFNQDVKNFLHKYYSNNLSLDEKMIGLRQRVDQFIVENSIKDQCKVLFGMSFSIYEPCRLHDFFLSQALRIKGAKIIPLSTVSEKNGKIHAVQEGENKMFGGVWGRFTGDPIQDQKIAEKHYRTIFSCDQLLWEKWCGIEPTSLTNYINNDDRQKIKDFTKTFPLSDYKNWHYKSMPVGKWASEALINNELVGHVKVINGWEQKLYHYLYNILLLYNASSKALDDINPDIIITNDTFDYPYAIFEHLAKQRSIPSYNSWCGGRKAGWCYSKGEPSMNLNLDRPWKKWKDRLLTVHETKLIQDFLVSRKFGESMLLNTTKADENAYDIERLGVELNFSKPTALLASNVIWDLAANDKDLLFDDMVSWIQNVLDFFKKNPDYQLIIKAHPGEKNINLPVTRQLISEEIRAYMPILPSNIILLEPESPISIYDIIPHIKLGLIYTSTAGLEMSAFGKPVVTCAKALYRDKGFTFDPKTVTDYFDTVTELLNISEIDSKMEQRKQLAQKFFYLYYFRYYASLHLFDYSFNEPPIPFISDINDLMPDVNPVLDYVSDSILRGLPLVSESRMLPEGGYVRNQYNFTSDELSLGGKMFTGGYSNQLEETIIGSENDFDCMRIKNMRFYVPRNCFKANELAWIYNETFLSQRENPHAYETEYLKIAPGDIVLDLGACAGFYIARALQKKADKIYAFEPHPKLMAGMEKSFEDEIIAGRVELYPYAVSNKNDDAFLDDSGNYICESKLNKHGNNKVKVRTLDSWALKENISKINFIKMDVEGEEMNTVRGAAGIIKRFKPILSIAVYHEYSNAQEIRELLLNIRPDYKIHFGGCYMFKTPFRPYMVYAH